MPSNVLSLTWIDSTRHAAERLTASFMNRITSEADRGRLRGTGTVRRADGDRYVEAGGNIRRAARGKLSTLPMNRLRTVEYQVVFGLNAAGRATLLHTRGETASPVLRSD